MLFYVTAISNLIIQIVFQAPESLLSVISIKPTNQTQLQSAISWFDAYN